MDDLDEALRLFPSRFWNTNDMPPQVGGSQYDLVDGFNLCSEGLKIAMDEIRSTVCRGRSTLIGRSIVMNHFDIDTIIIFSEMFGYLNCRLHDKPPVEEFVTAMTHHERSFYEKFGLPSSKEWREEYSQFPLESICLLYTSDAADD